MKISSFNIKNYKSFIDSGKLTFEDGFNVVVGQNNVGKTALLEALSLKFTAKPHKSSKTVPHQDCAVNPISNTEFSITLSGKELYDFLISHPDKYYFPVPKDKGELRGKEIRAYMDSIFQRDDIDIKYIKNTSEQHWRAAKRPSFDDFEAGRWMVAARVQPGSFEFDSYSCAQGGHDFGNSINQYLQSQIYCFRAERLNVGISSSGVNTILSTDASNLPEVLHVLQSKNPARFKDFNHFVSDIFPSIFEVRVIPKNNTTLETVIWTDNPESQRDDLTISLQDSGTGISQVLAILYVVITSVTQKIIIIDEPNSFLHPGAARKLIEILRRFFPQHQYIISTHSAEVLNAANPNTIKLLIWEKPETKVIEIDAGDLQDVTLCLSEIGSRLSDVFGMDKILWVEGQTEEMCFKEILKDIEDESLIGLSIVAVRNTGDFEGKHAELVWDVYTRISNSNSLLPPAVAFIFDRETKSDQQIEDITRKSKSNVQFLARRTYENYLLDSEVVANVLNKQESFKDNNVSEEQVKNWMLQHGNTVRYIENPVDNFTIANVEWVTKVDGATLLANMFVDLSESKEQYIKTKHSLQATQWMLNNKPEVLGELKDFLLQIIDEN